MEHLIKDSVRNIKISGIRQFNQKAKSIKDVVYLTIGQPNYDTPNKIKQGAIDAINHNHTQYTPNAGIMSLRSGISKYINEKYKLDYESDEVIVTVGSTEAFSIFFAAILNNGDEVIIPTPAYPGYEPLIKINRGKVVNLNTRSDNFQITEENLLNHITEKTKCILLTSPSNPTGAILSKQSIKNISNVIKDRDIFVISDEIYREIIFNNDYYSIAEDKSLKNKIIVINGFSKSHSMTGWRVGYLLAHKDIAKHLIKVHQYYVTSASSISQYASLEAITTDAEYMRDEYEERCIYAYQRLIDMGFECNKPEGAFYLFPSIKNFNKDSQTFCEDLLFYHKVACVPGKYFTGDYDDYIRISCATSMELLKKGLDRIEDYINTLK